MVALYIKDRKLHALLNYLFNDLFVRLTAKS